LTATGVNTQPVARGSNHITSQSLIKPKQRSEPGQGQELTAHRLYLLCVQHGEEIQTLQKRITHLETDLEQAKTQLTETNEKLEDANKNLSNVRADIYSSIRV